VKAFCDSSGARSAGGSGRLFQKVDGTTVAATCKSATCQDKITTQMSMNYFTKRKMTGGGDRPKVEMLTENRMFRVLEL